MLLALTHKQWLIVVVLAWILLVALILDWLHNATREPPLPHETRALKKELEKHKEDE